MVMTSWEFLKYTNCWNHSSGPFLIWTCELAYRLHLYAKHVSIFQNTICVCEKQMSPKMFQRWLRSKDRYLESNRKIVWQESLCDIQEGHGTHRSPESTMEKFENFLFVFSVLCNYLSLRKTVALHSNKLKFPSMYFPNFVIITHWKKPWAFIWTNLHPFHPNMRCAKLKLAEWFWIKRFLTFVNVF